MKKPYVWLSACVLAVSLVGCGTNDANPVASYEIAEAGSWKDGTYVETASGRNGDFEVTVIIKDGNIEEVSVGPHDETPDRGGKALEQLPEQMKDAQSYRVDAVTGATITSNGIKDAVARCLERASQ